MSSDEETNSHFWAEIAYTVQLRVVSMAGMVAICGQAHGIRDDGSPFFARYDLPLVYPEGFDWTREAKARLDTFLSDTCSCSQFGPCAYHVMLSEEWTKEDMLRNRLTEAEIPRPLKDFLVKMAKQV